MGKTRKNIEIGDLSGRQILSSAATLASPFDENPPSGLGQDTKTDELLDRVDHGIAPDTSFAGDLVITGVNRALAWLAHTPEHSVEHDIIVGRQQAQLSEPATV